MREEWKANWETESSDSISGFEAWPDSPGRIAEPHFWRLKSFAPMLERSSMENVVSPRAPWMLRSRGRLLAALFFTLAVPTLVLTALLHEHVRSEIVLQEKEQNKVTANLCAHGVDAEFHGLRRYVESFALRKTLIRAIESQDAASIAGILSDLVSQNPSVSRAVLADPRGVLLHDFPCDPDVAGRDFSHRDWYRGATETDGVYVSEFFRRTALGMPFVVAVAVPVRNAGRETIGVLVGQYEIGELLARVLKSVSRPVEKVCLLDHREHRACMDSVGRSSGTLVVEDLSNSMRSGATSPVPGTNTPAVELDRLSVTADVSSLGWKVEITRSLDDAFASLGILARNIAFFFLFCMTGMAGVGLLCFRTLAEYDAARERAVLALRAAHDDLERKVRVRTSELSSTNVSLEREIAQRKTSEAALASAKADLARKNADLEQFVYTASHDLKSPLVTFLGFLNYIRRDVEQSRFDRIPGFIETIEQAARRMRDRIDDLLELSRIGRVIGPAESVDVGDLVRNIVRDLSFADQGVHVTLAENFPVLHADRKRLRELLENLLSNALKYGTDASSKEVEVGCEQIDGEVRIFVKDEGPGIAPEYHERIFGLFQRLKTDQEGSGVGLAIVRRIAEAHGGSAWVESQPGEGATFRVSFPAAPFESGSHVRDPILCGETS